MSNTIAVDIPVRCTFIAIWVFDFYKYYGALHLMYLTQSSSAAKYL